MSENDQKITNLLTELNKYKGELRRKVQSLSSEIQPEKNVKQWYYRQNNELFDCLVHDINISDNITLTIDTYLCAEGWCIETFYRKGGTVSKLINLFDSLSIPYEKGDSENRLYCPDEFDYDAPLIDVAQCVKGLLDKLCSISIDD